MQLGKMLTICGALLTAGAMAACVGKNAGDARRTGFAEIDVKRINIRDANGMLRLVISNTQRMPGLIIHGEERPHPNRRTAGMLFFNEEGTENGALIFGGKAQDGKVSNSGHLSFDQYDQDQVIQITNAERGGQRYAALVVSDRPDEPFDEAMQRAEALPAGEAREAEIARIKKAHRGPQRVVVGKTPERAALLGLGDAEGRPRLRLQVQAGGTAAIEFLDESGKVVTLLGPEPGAGQP